MSAQCDRCKCRIDGHYYETQTVEYEEVSEDKLIYECKRKPMIVLCPTCWNLSLGIVSADKAKKVANE